MLPNLSLLDFLLLAFSTFAIAHYVTREDGPFAVFYRLRKAAGAEVDTLDIPAMGNGVGDEDEDPGTELGAGWEEMLEGDGEELESSPGRGSLAQLLSCPYCASPYAAVISLVLLLVAYPLLVVLSVLGMAVFMFQVIDR